MEYQLVREVCPVCETLLEGTKEQPIDVGLELPDYCPDIERILRCRVSPSVTGRSISGDMLEVNGSALLSLYYIDAKKQAVRLCEHSMPFSCSFQLREPAPDASVSVRLRPDYINCRAVSPRKADIHGAFSVIVSASAGSSQEYVTGIAGDDIQQSLRHETVSRLRCCTQQQFSITEVLDIGQGRGVPETILRSELGVSCHSVKALTDKLMLTGEAVLKIVYLTDAETGAQDSMSFNVPFSQVIDAAGADDGTVNDIRLEVMNYSAALRSEYDESSTLVTLDARLCATVAAYEDKEITVIEDAYSTDYDLELSYKQYRLTRLAALTDITHYAEAQLSSGDSRITQVTDLWCETVSPLCVYENGSISVRGKLLCCMLALDGDGVPFYMERPVEFSVSPDTPAGLTSPLIRTDVSVKNISFRITGDNTVDIRAELRLTGAVYDNVQLRGVSGVTASEDSCRVKDRTAALTLYYAEEGEKLWDIARAYCTSAEAIRLENEMTEDVVAARGMLLIPM